MSINLENMTAVQNKQQDGILGHLMWFSVGKQLVKMDDLEKTLVQSGYNEEFPKIRLGGKWLFLKKEVGNKPTSSPMRIQIVV